MKILVGEFITESNANIPQKCEISNYKMLLVMTAFRHCMWPMCLSRPVLN